MMTEVMSLIAITDRVLPGMRQRKWGRIITSTTSGAIAPIKNLAISNTLRAALLAWSKTLAAEVASEGITVNVIMPGRVATDRLKQFPVLPDLRNQPISTNELEFRLYLIIIITNFAQVIYRNKMHWN